MKTEFTRIAGLSNEQNELLRKAFDSPEKTKRVTTIPTADTIGEGEFRVYDDGTDKWLYSKVAGSIVSFKFNPDGTDNGTGLIIENRTSDPDSPATGQIWFRTDI